MVVELLDLDELAIDAAKGVGGAQVQVEAGLGIDAMGLQGQKDLAEVSGDDLEASGGEVEVAVAEDREGGFFVELVGSETLMEQEPVLEAALEPIGDVTGGEGETALGERLNDGGVRGAVFKQLVDEVAFGLREGSDFAGAAAGAEGIGGVME